MGRRTDVVLLIAGIVYVVEYKIGSAVHERYAIDQVTDYALDLKNFHESSHCKYVVPILVSTKAKKQFGHIEWSTDHISRALLSNGDDQLRLRNTRVVLFEERA